MELKQKSPFVLQQERVLVLYEELAEEIERLESLLDDDDVTTYDVPAQSLLRESKDWMLKMRASDHA